MENDGNRRKALKSLAAISSTLVAFRTLPEKWSKPIIESVILPAHAQSSQLPEPPAEPERGSVTWVTSAGTLGSDYTERLSSFTVNAVTEPEFSPVSYEISSGSLPGGMSIDPATGEISGTAVGVSDFSSTDFDFTITATNSTGASADRTFSITIASRYVGMSCVEVPEGGVASDTAPTGFVFNRTDFSSYGTPTGSCGSYSIGSCNSAVSNTYDPTPTISYSISADFANFGEPCLGTLKRLYIQMSYGPF